MTNEQLQKIIDEAPEVAEYYFGSSGMYYRINNGIVECNSTRDSVGWVGSSFKIRDLQRFVKIQKQHPHATLMAQYAEDAAKTDKPWELWQSSVLGKTWSDHHAHPRWDIGVKYRRKPKPEEKREYVVIRKGKQVIYTNGETREPVGLERAQQLAEEMRRDFPKQTYQVARLIPIEN